MQNPMKFLLHTRTLYHNYNYINIPITNYINFIFNHQHHYNYKSIKLYSQFQFQSYHCQNDFNQKSFRIHSHNAAQFKMDNRKGSWLVNSMPSTVQPYLKLIRLDRPIGKRNLPFNSYIYWLFINFINKYKSFIENNIKTFIWNTNVSRRNSAFLFIGIIRNWNK